jgi:uncharacterized protein YprB with RNaseH-like and TPR domain
MLRATFAHLHGVGLHTERRIWDAGIGDWADLLARPSDGLPLSARDPSNRSLVQRCLAAYGAGDWSFLDRALPSSLKWRAYGDLGGRALFLDIETTGDAANEITVIGLYDGFEARAFVADRDLGEALRIIDRHPLLITYNGAFDLPILRAHFRGEPINALHLDLLHPLRRLGLRGGLKACERRLGIERPDAVRGMDGWDAVRLWRAHRLGSGEALDLLLEYNRQDIVNLKPLAEFAFSRLRAAAGMRG